MPRFSKLTIWILRVRWKSNLFSWTVDEMSKGSRKLNWCNTADRKLSMKRVQPLLVLSFRQNILVQKKKWYENVPSQSCRHVQNQLCAGFIVVLHFYEYKTWSSVSVSCSQYETSRGFWRPFNPTCLSLQLKRRWIYWTSVMCRVFKVLYHLSANESDLQIIYWRLSASAAFCCSGFHIDGLVR